MKQCRPAPPNLLKSSILIIVALTVLYQPTIAFAQTSKNLVVNGQFEEGSIKDLPGWYPLWCRENNKGTATLDSDNLPGTRVLRIDNNNDKDFSFAQSQRLPVAPGEIYELSGKMKVDDHQNEEATATISTVLRKQNGDVIDWSYGGKTLKGTNDWTELKRKFIIPQNAATIEFRIMGVGNATSWFDDVSLVWLGSLDNLQKKFNKSFTLENDLISLEINGNSGLISVRDKRTNTTWQQIQTSNDELITNIKQPNSQQLQISLTRLNNDKNLQVTWSLEKDSPEATVTITADGTMDTTLNYPYPFASKPGDYLVIPMNEGISYPVQDKTINPMELICYGGHGICMAFWGETSGKDGYMTIVETPDDAKIRIDRPNDALSVSPIWQSQKGQYGYPRTLRYVFFEKGGHVAICKRYRQYAESIGLVKTLRQKQKENPNVDLLIGAVNVWTWDKDALYFVKEMKSVGIDRILWSSRRSPNEVRQMNEIGNVLTSRYDIYQDLMDPQVVKDKIGWTHGDWTQDGWPDDLMIGSNGQWVRGWKVRGKDKQLYPCGTLCDKQAPDYARKRIAAELKETPYRCRFIDTTTASPWRECYDPAHPMTRTESKRYKMELLRVVSEEMNLVTGCETGHDASVPYLHYFEGMMSLGPYRVPDAGRDMIKVVNDVPERVAKFQLGENYRLPLWELVYHDCTVAQWYWGDYNNKLPSLWDKRDLFNLLYGTGPMFMFNKQIWQDNKDRFAQSYQTICPTLRKVGYEQMTDHQFLTSNRKVQMTRFSNGVSIIVNFGDKEFETANGNTVGPMGYWVSEKSL